MSKLQITNAGLSYKDAVFAAEQTQNISHFVFAHVPGLDENADIDPNTTVPEQYVVHTQPVQAVTRIDSNAVALSTVLGHEVGDFDYNWYGALATLQDNSQVLVAVAQTALQSKHKSVPGRNGNYSAKSIIWRSQGIADELNITVAALPWQVQEGEFVSQNEFDGHRHDNRYVRHSSLPFINADALALYRRHKLTDGIAKTAPAVATLADGDWFSVKNFGGLEPVLHPEGSAGEQFKRVSDNQVAPFVNVLSYDLRELVFVYNKTTNLWEF
ncbi:phage tail protein [Pseudoalteromonas sp. CNC9-20]|uniref:phage tail-collar fiber domain-containing protein n=1 Tax=Pseudoalteromonas sp. CNC9-20 TaxID=2917750 RepID=UPI001EF6FDD9|nr:phage tail protein [Pseudoalteromonas sp. CNC9-20]MCG7570555.1 phage tail protein [Pseudoalteromonas sp. CNC9-20]